MKKYRIKVVETLSKVVEVEAENYDLAFEKVEEMVDCEEVVLTADDFEGREFLFWLCSILRLIIYFPHIPHRIHQRRAQNLADCK